MKLKEAGLRTGLLAAGLLAALVMGEGVCWFMGMGATECRPVPPAPVRVMDPFHYRLPPDYDGRLECPRSAWSRPGFSVGLRTNRHGFRDPERSPEPPPDTTRILLLGDSFAMGFAVEREQTLGARLEEMLAASRPGRRFEVLNTGIWGLNTEMEANLYASTRGLFGPDLVLLVYVLNDAELEPGQPVPGENQAAPAGAAPVAEPQRGWLAWLGNGLLDRGLRWSRLVRTGYDVWRWQIQGKERSNMTEHHGRLIRDYNALHAEDLPGWQSVRRGLDRLARTTNEEGIPAAVLIFPMMIDLSGEYPYQEAHRRVTDAARLAGLPVLDLRPAFAGHEGRDLWVTASDNHPDAEANRLAAEAVAGWLGTVLLPAGGTGSGVPAPSP